MSTLRVDTITDEAGTGAPNFPNGATGLEPFKYNAVSGATQALDVGTYNFFDAGTLTADTTVSFSNVPTEARWTYTAEAGVLTSYDLANAFFGGPSFVTSGQDTSGSGVTFSPDGLNMYVTGRQTDRVYQYTLQIPWSLPSAYYRGFFSVGSQQSDPWGVSFKPDGTKMYLGGYSPSSLFQYSLSTAWDVSTASYDSVSLNTSSQSSITRNPVFKPDGTKLYVIGGGNYSIYQYSLSTAWDLSTASYDSVSLNVIAQDTNPMALQFKPDGTKMYFVGSTSDTIFEYSLSTAWDLSTASYSSVSFVVSSKSVNPFGMYLHPEGLYVYILDGGINTVFSIDMGSSTTIALPASVENPPLLPFYAGSRASYDLFTADGGTTVTLIGEEIT